VDRATFPSDTVSTHFLHPPAVAKLRRWGLLDRLVATGCPAVPTYSFDFGPFTLTGSPHPVEGISVGYGPRRTVLDKLLVDAAVQAGAELREHFSVEEVLLEDGAVVGIRGHANGGSSVVERARVVIGADGDHSLVARAVDAPRYNQRPALQSSYYTYWRGLNADAFEAHIRPGRGWGVIPTHDGLTCVVVGWPIAEFDANKRDIEGNYLKTLEMSPEFHERIRGAVREARFVGAAEDNFYRTPFGPGWALVGDAGYHKDPITAMGISDAFRDAELLADALDAVWAGGAAYDDALGRYQQLRDAASLPTYELTLQFASMEPPPPQMQHLLGAIHGNQDATDDFISVQAGTMPVPDFFAPENVGRYVAAAGARPPAAAVS
jgi:flavin-dependent dehydrogenase